MFQIPNDLTSDEKTAAIKKLYELLPTIDCKGLCTAACTDIDMSNHERSQIDRRHQISIVSRDYNAIALRGLKPCRALGKDGRCKVYEDRPLVCRAFGVTEAMKCPFGCEASRLLSDEEYKGLDLAVEEIGGHWYRTSQDRAKILRDLMTPAGKAALKRQYDTARAEVARMKPEVDDANSDRSDVRREPVD